MIGAGVGSLIALSLAQHDLDVVLVDERPTILGGASRAQMARLHLGHHYSGDDRFTDDRLNTAQRCSLGAVAWMHRYPEVAPIEGRWWQLITTDSMTSADDYASFGARLAAYQDQLAADDPVARRLFGPPGRSARTLDAGEYAPFVTPGRVVLGVETRERVIDLAALRRSIERDLSDSDRVEVMLSTRVRAVHGGTESGFAVDLGSGEQLRADLVVNCSGHDVGALAGRDGNGPGPMSTRLRLVAIAALPERLRPVPSMFFHRGVYGSHTNLDGRTMRFVSEAVSNVGTAPGVGVPAAWRRLMLHPRDPGCWVDGLRAALAMPGAAEPTGGRGPGPWSPLGQLTLELGRLTRGGRPGVGADLQDRVGAALVEGYADLVPAVRDCSPVLVTPTASVDMGHTDIWKPHGSVHRRDWHTHVDATGLVTVIPGKFTFGALVADEATAHVLRLVDHGHRPGPDQRVLEVARS